jgi:hypothetical protein
MLPGVTLSVINAELVKRESRDEAGHYHQFVVQERELENSKKPHHATAGKAAKETTQELAVQGSGGQEGQVNLAPAKSAGRGAPCGKASVRGRGRGRGARGRAEAGGKSAAVGGDQGCWNCGSLEHCWTDCPTATAEEIVTWNLQNLQRSRRARPAGCGTHQRGGGCGKAAAAKAPAEEQPPEEDAPPEDNESGN